MNRDIEIFVQAFWVKCRDVIRPELDRVIHELEAKGHVAHVSTQEYDPGAAQGLAGDNPTLTLTLHPNKAPTGRTPNRACRCRAGGARVAWATWDPTPPPPDR